MCDRNLSLRTLLDSLRGHVAKCHITGDLTNTQIRHSPGNIQKRYRYKDKQSPDTVVVVVVHALTYTSSLTSTATSLPSSVPNFASTWLRVGSTLRNSFFLAQ